MERPLCDRSAQPPDYPAAHLSRMGNEKYTSMKLITLARQWAEPTQPQVGISRSGALKQSQVLGNRQVTRERVLKWPRLSASSTRGRGTIESRWKTWETGSSLWRHWIGHNALRWRGSPAS